MRRRLFNAACAASLLLCAAALVLWVRSYRALDLLAFGSPEWAGGLESRRGQIAVSSTRMLAPGRFPYPFDGGWALAYERGTPGRPGAKDRVYESWPVAKRHWHAAGFRWFWTDGKRPTAAGVLVSPTLDVAVPHWLIAALLASAPAARLARYRRRQARRRAGAAFCDACDYDLTGNVSGTCPECGAAIKSAPARHLPPPAALLRPALTS